MVDFVLYRYWFYSNRRKICCCLCLFCDHLTTVLYYYQREWKHNFGFLIKIFWCNEKEAKKIVFRTNFRSRLVQAVLGHLFVLLTLAKNISQVTCGEFLQILVLVESCKVLTLNKESKKWLTLISFLRFPIFLWPVFGAVVEKVGQSQDQDARPGKDKMCGIVLADGIWKGSLVFLSSLLSRRLLWNAFFFLSLSAKTVF